MNIQQMYEELEEKRKPAREAGGQEQKKPLIDVNVLREQQENAEKRIRALTALIKKIK
jgi:hypothetical protein